MSDFLSLWIGVCVLGSLFVCHVLIEWVLHRPDERHEAHKVQYSHQSWGDVRSYDHPVPRSWLYLLYACTLFALIYFSLYPALGTFPGVLRWTSQQQYKDEVGEYNLVYTERFNRYLARSITEIASDPVARTTGQHLFMSYCSNCHQGAGEDRTHYPKLTDRDWLWGGHPEQIEATILHGRTGIMPAWGSVLGEKGVEETASYVMTLAGYKPANPEEVAAGKEHFAAYCAFCHSAGGRGDPRQGAPRLTDKTWMHISSKDALSEAGLEAGVRAAIADGFVNLMPPHWNTLDRAQIHVLAGYVYSLSN